MKKEDKRFYMTAPEVAGIVGVMGAMFTAIPWADISPLDKAAAFCSICILSFGAVAVFEMTAEMAVSMWRQFKARKSMRAEHE